jgi:hypothetical protein
MLRNTRHKFVPLCMAYYGFRIYMWFRDTAIWVCVNSCGWQRRYGVILALCTQWGIYMITCIHICRRACMPPVPPHYLISTPSYMCLCHAPVSTITTALIINHSSPISRHIPPWVAGRSYWPLFVKSRTSWRLSTDLQSVPNKHSMHR